MEYDNATFRSCCRRRKQWFGFLALLSPSLVDLLTDKFV